MVTVLKSCRILALVFNLLSVSIFACWGKPIGYSTPKWARFVCYCCTMSANSRSPSYVAYVVNLYGMCFNTLQNSGWNFLLLCLSNFCCCLPKCCSLMSELMFSSGYFVSNSFTLQMCLSQC